MARALVRGLASTFANAITSTPLAEPIALDIARQQHQGYTDLLRRLLGAENVHELPADDRHPGVAVGGGSCVALLVRMYTTLWM